VELDPKSTHFLVLRAYAHLGKRQPVLAMADLDQALAVKADDAEALTARGELYLASHDLARAKRDFDAALKSAPAEGLLPLQIAAAYTGVDEFTAALAVYDSWIAAHPKHESLWSALNGRCWTRTLSGRDLPLALADCDLALRKGGRTAAVYDSRGLTLYRLGRMDEALSDYTNALKLQPKLAWSLYGRGLIELAKGQKKEGEADIGSATELNPAIPVIAKRVGIVPAEAQVAGAATTRQ
jgi:tetratricopeptide (TPR) repeat protein